MTGSPSPELSVVIPVFRNRDSLEDLVLRVCRILDSRRMTFELILVEDACPAGSWEQIAKIAKHEPRLRGLSLSHNVGQHTAILVGLSDACGDWCLVMDADLQDPPEVIPELLDARSDDVAAVFGARHGDYETRGRLLTSRVFKRIQHWLCDVPADAGLFVALRRGLVDRLITMPGPRPSVVAMIGCAGCRSRSVRVERAVRNIGRSSYRSWHRMNSGLRAIGYIIVWRFRRAKVAEPSRYRALIRERCGKHVPTTRHHRPALRYESHAATSRAPWA